MRQSLKVASAITAVVLVMLTWPSIASAQSETVEYYGLDALGSVRVIFDQQGNVVDRMDYDPFGANLRAAIKFPTEQFAQLARDAESGKDYAQARNYSALAGRFNRLDPVYAGLFNSQGWNRYAYAANNPLGYVDATGLCIDPIVTNTSSGVCADLDNLPLRGIAGGAADDLILAVDVDHTQAQGTSAGSNTPPPHTDDLTSDPGSNPTSPLTCEVFSQWLADSAAASGYGRRERLGVALLEVATTVNRGHPDPFVRSNADFDSFRPELTAGGQNNQVYRHVLGGAGTYLARRPWSFVGQTISDYLGSRPGPGRPLTARNRESYAEMLGNIAGVKVGFWMEYASATGTSSRAGRMIRRTLCK